MLKLLVPVAALALAAGPVFAQTRAPSGPTPNEQVGIHVGDNATNGSATIVKDRTGVHPDGYPGMATRNNATSAAKPPHRHRHHVAATPPQG